MTLRHKFGSLALIYVVSLIVNVIFCAWCILAYHHATLESLSGTRIELDSVGIVAGEEPATTESSAGTTLVQAMTEEHESGILRILLLNALCGLALALLGLRLVKRWVSRPVAALREAAVEIGQGNFSHRVPVASRDELGLLAGEVNNMAATVVTTQDRLIEQERRLVAGQALRCVVHNIRSPLTGIRWLAEAVAMRKDVDGQFRDRQNRIVQLVDDILAWLQGFRDSLAAASLQVKPVRIAAVFQELVRSVADLAKERDIVVEQDPSASYEVCIDIGQARPALEALLRCALTCCTRGQTVRLSAERDERPQRLWRLIITCGDRHPGQPDKVRTAAPDRSRLGQLERGDLKMAERAIQMHGGQLEVRGDSGRCRFVVTLPDQCGADQHG
jgi:signal transduction histidine kinase